MQRKLLATVAAAPLLVAASMAAAEVTVTTAVTSPVSTAAASSAGPDNLRITSSGSVKPTAAGAAATLNSNHTLVNEGEISTTDVNDSIGILVLGGYSGGVTNSGTISILDSLEVKDTDNDGDLDGPMASGSGRYGIRITGPGTFTGNIANTGSITVRGANSYGISNETTLIGQLRSSGGISVVGPGSYGIRSTGVIGSSVDITGSISAVGEGATGVSIENDVAGQVHIQSSVIAYGYRYVDRPFLKEYRDQLESDDLLKGGPGVRIAGNLGGGLLFDGPPPDLIPDDGKSETTNDSDEDNDGVADALEGAASIAVYGSAPAVIVGSDTQAITLNPVGIPSLSYGIVNRGSISAEGVYDGVAATGLQIGGNTGQTTTIVNGMYNAGSITASSYEANATAVKLTAGANVPTLVHDGVISAGVTAEGEFNAKGLTIADGATLGSLKIGKAARIGAGVSGEKGSATAIEDLSGSLRDITNSGNIVAVVTPTDDSTDTDDADSDPNNEVVTGRAIALDLRAAKAGITLTQTGITDGDDLADGIADADADGDGVDDADEPTIIGDVLLGAYDDTLNINNGTVVGAISFGAGADALNIAGGARVTGAITDSDGRLAINIASGALSFTNAQTINITSLNVASGGELLFVADPLANSATKLVASGNVNLASGAKIGLTLKSILDAPTRYTVIEAGSLTAGSLSQDLLGSTPYLYTAVASADQAAGKVYIDVRQRTAAELGFNKAQTSAYSAVTQALKGDAGVSSAVLAQTTRGGLTSLYDQLMPDTGEGAFASLQSVNQLLAQATGLRPDPYDRYGPDSFWAQEINTLVRRDDGDTLGSDSKVFGFMGGYESMSTNGGALGLTLAYVNIEEHDNAAVVGEQTTASIVQGGVYWRRSMGGLLMNAGVGGGYGWFSGDRRFIAPDLNADGAADVIRTNKADWNGLTGNAYVGLAYQAMLGRFYARPELRADYIYLREGERKESGGGSALDLTVAERTGSNLSGEAAIVFGANFGRDVWFRPEIRVGYRQTLSGELGDTVAQFAGGTPFVITPDSQDDGALTLNLALRSGTPMSYVAVEAGAEARKKQKRYNVRLAGRVMF